MRPDTLAPLFASAETLTGVGPRVAGFLTKAVRLPPGVDQVRVLDLLWHVPTGVIDRRAEPTLAEAEPGTIATFAVRVLKHKPPPRGNNRVPYRVVCEDETGRLDLVFFHAERRFIERQLPEGETRYVSGRVDRYGDQMQMLHPDYVLPPDQRDRLPMLEPVYGLTAGLTGKVLAKIMRQTVDRIPEMPVSDADQMDEKAGDAAAANRPVRAM
ncbi:MAG: OB-fold nucleic acid binding domain-containing protein [Pseudomonadota bacterium]